MDSFGYCPLLLAGATACEVGAPDNEIRCRTSSCAWWSLDGSECIVVRGVQESSRQLALMNEALLSLPLIAEKLDNLNRELMRHRK